MRTSAAQVNPIGAVLPRPRGPVSAGLLATLTGDSAQMPEPDVVASVDPLGDDVQLALYTCYEMHYQGFAGVSPAWEWDLGLLRLRAALEEIFRTALRAATSGSRDVAGALAPLLVEPVDEYGISHHLRDEGTRWQLREYLAHRSLYHLKEADPHAWVIPRLRGRAKAALVAVEFDEFGGGRAERMHSQLFADMMAGIGLDAGYLRYLDVVPAPALAIVNLMSMFGLHRSWRGALVGHFAAAEITTSPSARRMAQALERLGLGEHAAFYTEHVAADAVHEQVMRHDVVGDLVVHEPELSADVVFGIEATGLLEDRLTEHVMSAWRNGRTSLREPLPDPGASA
ncbi:hypothetical protein GCM10011581_45720 [Saccharopolyspora subtropica]|uniref:Iron-containing redox enzyme family protein n=1 Tax=Saccharopolyspora thermophila TaxID=89367 RepID=A0A917NIN6_9PSEU|nr:iron-containing redox enzyme family protein [Saccharopolyspora subtropica]GGJ03483.1 hypothetical protein GCM10011581_45720 [Saccharopolyspora subtropica]